MTNKIIQVRDLKIKFKYEVSYFKDYIKSNVKEIENRNKKIIQLLEEEIKEGKTEESTLRRVYEDDLFKLPSYFYHSTIVSIYSLLESTLMEMCEITKRDLEFKLSVYDYPTRDYLGKAVTYLEKLININFKKDCKEWNYLNDFRNLRNIIVHQNSKFNAEPTKKENELIKRLKDIVIDQSDFKLYVIDPKLITQFLDLACNLIENTFYQIENKEFKLMEIIDKDPFELTF